MRLGLQLQEQRSSSIEPINQSLQKLNPMGKTTSSQDQCASSESGNDASSYSIHDEGNQGQNVNPYLFLCNPEFPLNASQAEIIQPMMQFPYSFADPYLTGLYTAYGPHHMIQPQVMAAASGRVPLPGDLPEDGPIYVNAKQYHGILRRRQTRAKLEAQNKLLKNRRPYLHESRHKHALNRVRGSGGRFLSTKKPQNSDTGSADSFHLNHNGNMSETNMHQFGISNQHDGTTSSAFQHHPEGRFSSISPHMAVSMQGNGVFVYNGNRHCASIVR